MADSTQAQSPVSLPKGVEMRANVVYGKGGGHDLTLDLFLPKDAARRKPMPGMIFMHGGGWSAGARTQFHWQSAQLAAEGIVSATISYRFSDEAKYPAAVEDAKCAVRWMRANAKNLNVDPNRICCGGGSAGGHLAAMLATTSHLKKLEGTGGHEGASSRVCLGVLFNPAVDMRDLPHPAATDCARLFLGAKLDERPDLYEEASPISHVSKDTAPCLLFHGTADIIVPHAQSVRFKVALQAVNVPVEIVSVEGQPHGFFNKSPFRESTYAKMLAWLRQRFAVSI